MAAAAGTLNHKTRWVPGFLRLRHVPTPALTGPLLDTLMAATPRPAGSPATRGRALAAQAQLLVRVPSTAGVRTPRGRAPRTADDRGAG